MQMKKVRILQSLLKVAHIKTKMFMKADTFKLY